MEKKPNILPDMNLKLDVFCVMPIHFYAIIEIGRNKYNKPFTNTKTTYLDGQDGFTDAIHHVCKLAITTPSSSLPFNNKKNKFGPQRKNLGSIMCEMNYTPPLAVGNLPKRD